jgi:hypothetical protein
MTQREIVEQLSAIMNLRTRELKTQKEDSTWGRIFDMLANSYNLNTVELEDELFDSDLFWKLEDAMSDVIVRHFEE